MGTYIESIMIRENDPVVMLSFYVSESDSRTGSDRSSIVVLSEFRRSAVIVPSLFCRCFIVVPDHLCRGLRVEKFLEIC